MLAKVKSDRCESDRYQKTGLVVRKNGKTYKDRVCYICGKEHYHRENMCISCRNDEQQQRHGKRYIKRKDMPGEIHRKVSLAAHAKRIAREMEAIEAAGLSPSNSTIEEIEAAGVELEEFDISGLGKVVLGE